jgi:hypothetical protein
MSEKYKTKFFIDESRVTPRIVNIEIFKELRYANDNLDCYKLCFQQLGDNLNTLSYPLIENRNMLHDFLTML